MRSCQQEADLIPRRFFPRLSIACALSSAALVMAQPSTMSAASGKPVTAPLSRGPSVTALHRYSFSRTFWVQGRVTRPNPFTSPAARTFQKNVQRVSSKRVAIIARVISQEPGALIVRQVPWQTHSSGSSKLAYAHTSAVPGASAPRITVHLTARTLVYASGGMTGLHAGTTVFIGGSVVNRRFGAYIISSLQRAASGAHLYRALTNQLVHLPRSTMTRRPQRPAQHPTPLDNNLNFTGEFGGPSYNFNSDLGGDIDIFDVGVVTVYLHHFSFLASLDGWTYNWPMTFTGSTASSLVMTEQNSVNLNVLPQPGGNGSFTDTFSGGIGVNIGIGFHIYTAVGCGTADLQSCDFYPTLDLGVGLLNETQDAAPLASGQDLNVPSVECPSVGFSIPDTDISVADVGICNTFLIHGANFNADASATGATMTPATLSFNGTDPHSVTLTPTANPVDVTLNNFLWDPTLDYGLHARIRIVHATVWTSPTVTLVSGAFPMIADAATRSAAGFNDVVGQFAQPSSTDFIFPASKESTTITSTSPATGVYHDPTQVSATLTDRLGRPVDGKTLTFTLNGSSTETCQGVTDAQGHASCSVTPTDVPAPGTLSISFTGDDTYFGSSASPAFTILKEDTTLAYTGDQLIANNRPATLKAVLLEDGTTAPVPSGRAVVLTLGSGGTTQSCTGYTDSTGLAQCTIANVNQPLGTDAVAASFTNDPYYLPSSDSGTRLVFSYLPGGGAFAIGDSSASAVYFWGAQWSSHNTLSGGAAQPSFKGFAQTFTPAGDPACGSSWTTAPGNSPPPPATVPSYVAVVEASHVTKNGSTISGDTTRVVIVKTNPGYGPDPSQVGTGTIVATLCG